MGSGIDYQNMLVIGDDNYMDYVGKKTIVDGERKGKGLIPRDYTLNPVGSYKSTKPFDPMEIPLIPREEWSERIEEMTAKKMRINDIREAAGIEVLDQNGQGYCWAYSTAMCVMMARMMSNQPYVRLSAHSVAWTIKNGRDQGGWGCQSADFIQDRGIMPTSLWPEKSMEGRTWGTERNWEDAAKFKITEAWMELSPRQYDRNLTFDQLFSLLLSGIPCVCDYNWWGYSVAVTCPYEIDKRMGLDNPNRWAVGTPNSWGTGWGTRGYGIIKGSKAIPDGGLAVRLVGGDDYALNTDTKVNLAV